MIGAEDPGQITRRHGALIDYLEPLLDRRRATLDHAQVAALDRLQQLADELVAFKAARRSRLKRLFAAPDVPRGVYLHGGVGRGKSLLMDAFFATVAIGRRARGSRTGRARVDAEAKRHRSSRRQAPGAVDA